MEKKKAGWRQKLVAFMASCLFVLILLGLGELYCRYFLDINLRKTSKEFVISDPSGRVIANAASASGISFGVPVFSDENGFRIPEGYMADSSRPAVMILGDSVTFGVGVPEEKTFAGLFRASEADVSVYNSSVIGYSIPDYKRVIESFVPAHPEVRHVYLFYCLNDFQASDNSSSTAAAETGPWRRFKLQVASAFSDLNEFMGPRSKLYVYLTGITIDPSSRYFELDSKVMDVDDERFGKVMQPIVDIDDLLKQRGILFTVFLNPYERQLRDGANGNFKPQDRIAAFFKLKGIKVVDTRDKFPSAQRSADAFLFADPMHLSATGHSFVFRALKEDWEGQNQYAR